MYPPNIITDHIANNSGLIIRINVTINEKIKTENARDLNL